MIPLTCGIYDIVEFLQLEMSGLGLKEDKMGDCCLMGIEFHSLDINYTSMNRLNGTELHQ